MRAVVHGAVERSFDGEAIAIRISQVREILPGNAAAKPTSMEDLIVLGDTDTVFGALDGPSERLPREYRSHGSLHEMDVPLVIHNAQAKLAAEDFHYNWELARWLYQG